MHHSWQHQNRQPVCWPMTPLCTRLPINGREVPTHSIPMKMNLLMLNLAAASMVPATAADLYWNGANIAANPANGGSGTWSTTNAWRSVSATGDQATWAAGSDGTDNAFLAGSAGTVTLGTSGDTNFTGANLSVSTSGYSITSASGSRNLSFTGTMSLESNVSLTLNMNASDALLGRWNHQLRQRLFADHSGKSDSK